MPGSIVENRQRLAARSYVVGHHGCRARRERRDFNLFALLFGVDIEAGAVVTESRQRRAVLSDAAKGKGAWQLASIAPLFDMLGHPFGGSAREFACIGVRSARGC